jgi:malate dehydrogenase (oxaloacetate-decarboxylating)
LTLKEDAINLHRLLRGKIEISSRISSDNIFENSKEEGSGTLSSIYTPGVAYVSTEIKMNKELAYDYTSKWNNIAIVCDGTRVRTGRYWSRRSIIRNGRKSSLI